jgi:hypothetical protein
MARLLKTWSDVEVTQRDLTSACKGFSTGGNSSPAGGGVRGTGNVAEADVDMMQCFR